MGNLTDSQLYISLAIAALLGGSLAYLLWKERQRAKVGLPKPRKAYTGSVSTGVNTLQLQLHAYERLALLAERIALFNVINRVTQQNSTAREMQLMLVNTIKQEFEHNVSQQIYVSPEAWDAIRNLKDQNIHIVNQVASYLPEDATGNDLNKHILEMLIQNPKASLHHVVSEALSYEAKKLLKQS